MRARAFVQVTFCDSTLMACRVVCVQVLSGGAIRVFDKSYKGSNLSLMVELLAGPLVGAAISDKIAEKNWGNLVIVVDPGLLGDKAEIRARTQSVLDRRVLGLVASRS